METVVPDAVFCVVEEIGDFLGGFEGGEDVGEEGGVVAAAGFEDEFAGCSALDSRVKRCLLGDPFAVEGSWGFYCDLTSSLMLVVASA